MLVLAVLGAAIGVGTWSAFSSTTQNTGNTFQAGTVVLGDNDGEALPLYTVTGQKPGQNTVKCIKVSYTGTLEANVKMYATYAAPTGGQFVNLTIEKGTSDTSTFPNCGTFTAEATIYTGTLSDFATKVDFGTGVGANPGSATKWIPNDSLVYRFSLSVADDDNAQGVNIAAHGFKWEARNI
jgi:predicted ribosomally synthesized peptide with SipW-like signal peptide